MLQTPGVDVFLLFSLPLVAAFVGNISFALQKTLLAILLGGA